MSHYKAVVPINPVDRDVFEDLVQFVDGVECGEIETDDLLLDGPLAIRLQLMGIPPLASSVLELLDIEDQSYGCVRTDYRLEDESLIVESDLEGGSTVEAAAGVMRIVAYNQLPQTFTFISEVDRHSENFNGGVVLVMKGDWRVYSLYEIEKNVLAEAAAGRTPKSFPPTVAS